MLLRKHSKKRDAILAAMRETQSHPGAQWVYDRLKPEIPDLSLGTVYRNISVFLKERRLISVGVVNGEERFDACVEPHPHFVCEQCGKVFDIPFADDNALSQVMYQNLRMNEFCALFSVDFRKTVFYGVCPHCARPPRRDSHWEAADQALSA